MKLLIKGKFRGVEQLPMGTLPDNAVCFREPEDVIALNKQASLFLIPTIIGILIVIIAAVFWRGEFPFSSLGLPLFLGIGSAFLLIIPHELLHGLCFGKDAEVEMYYSPKDMMAFVISTKPISKCRFIMLSLCPNMILGWFPFLCWAFLGIPEWGSQFLFGCSLMMILMGCGDYMNIWNAYRQMPKGSMQQLAGFHSYWFVP